MRSAASQQFLNWEKRPLLFFFFFFFVIYLFFPRSLFFAPRSVGGWEQRGADACEGPGWEQGKEKAVTVKSSGAKPPLNPGRTCSEVCPCVRPFPPNPDCTVGTRVWYLPLPGLPSRAWIRQRGGNRVLAKPDVLFPPGVTRFVGLGEVWERS